MLRIVCLVLISIGLSGCLSVREQDLMSWVDRPVSDLELHPVFNTIPVVKTKLQMVQRYGIT